MSSLSRRRVLGLIGVGTLLSACGGDPEPKQSAPTKAAQAAQDQAALAVTVYKDPTCGCCGGWIKHAEANGISVTVDHPDDLNAVFAEHKIAADVSSCHLALATTGELFVGHVPVKYINQYLADPPKHTRGLTVPAMPVGTPGMEMGGKFEPYDVLLLNSDGSTKVFAKVASAADQSA